MATVEEAELIGNKEAAERAGVSITYFQQLAQQQPTITPRRVAGTRVAAWTVDQVKEIGARKKR